MKNDNCSILLELDVLSYTKVSEKISSSNRSDSLLLHKSNSLKNYENKMKLPINKELKSEKERKEKKFYLKYLM